MNTTNGEARTEELARWLGYITDALDREPRGLREIVGWNDAGQPAVIRVAPVVDGKPFPTLYWLIDPQWNLLLDRLEASGQIAALQAMVDQSATLRSRMREDHALYRDARDRFMTLEEKQFLEAGGMMSAFTERGIGGIVDPDRVRCLHTWYAAHWVQPNSIGGLIDDIVARSD